MLKRKSLIPEFEERTPKDVGSDVSQQPTKHGTNKGSVNITEEFKHKLCLYSAIGVYTETQL